MQRVLWDEAAELDLLRIMDFIGRHRHSIAAAAKVVRALRDKAAAYARQPEMGTLHPELGRQIRSFRVGNYVAFYEPADDGILVLRSSRATRTTPPGFARRKKSVNHPCRSHTSAAPTTNRPMLITAFTWKKATFTRVRSSGRTSQCS